MSDIEVIWGGKEEDQTDWQGFIGGWLVDEEDTGYLQSLGTADESMLALRTMGYEEQSIDPREVLKVENQSMQGACQGHSISSNIEWCFYLSGGDLNTQLSRAMGYYETQRIDGISGDRGSTISGGVKLAKTTGICKESLWPYPSRYNNRRPANYSDVLKSAKDFKLKNSVRLTSYDDVRTFLGSGQGGVNVGISWGSGMSTSVVERFSPGGGGHAIMLPSLSKRKDNSGKPYVWMMNSWGSRFGNKGWSEWSPNAIHEMFKHRFTVFIGVSDMVKSEPRKFSEEMWKKVAQQIG